MNRLYPRHFITYALVHQYDMSFGSTGHYVRKCTQVYASPGVTWQDIEREAESKSDDDYLVTVTTPFELGLVSMNVGKFKALDEELRARNVKHRNYRLAKELTTSRDCDLNGGHENPNHKWRDYWPKD